MRERSFAGTESQGTIGHSSRIAPGKRPATQRLGSLQRKPASARTRAHGHHGPAGKSRDYSSSSMDSSMSAAALGLVAELDDDDGSRSSCSDLVARGGAANPATAGAVAGRDAPVPIRPLDDADRQVDLVSARFRDQPRLQAAFDNRRAIRMFDKGPAVRILQEVFLELGFLMPRSTKRTEKPDEIFGLETFRVVKGFQLRQGIVQDGVVGRQTLGELDGLLSGQPPPGTRPSGPDQPGSAISVSTTDVSPQQFGSCGGFAWSVDWVTNARNGYLVQEITKEYKSEMCNGQASVFTVTPHYWEAWRVQEDGGIHGTSGADDDWKNPSMNIDDELAGVPGSRGRWRTVGRVFFVPQLDPAAGFQVANVPDAGSLWSTTSRPGNLGPVLLVREAGDTWNCCGGKSPTAQTGTSAEQHPDVDSECGTCG